MLNAKRSGVIGRAYDRHLVRLCSAIAPLCEQISRSAGSLQAGGYNRMDRTGWPLETLLCGVVDTNRKSTRLNSSHSQISYAVFCLKKKKNRCNNAACVTSADICRRGAMLWGTYTARPSVRITSACYSRIMSETCVSGRVNSHECQL